MTKDVIVAIKGLQVENNDEPVELVTRGRYYNKNNKHYICYDEMFDEKEITKSTIIVKGNDVEVIRKGSTSSHMVFQEHRKNTTYYNMPFGSMLLGINATHVNVEEQEDKMNIDIKYGLEVNYNFVSDCNINIEVKSHNESA